MKQILSRESLDWRLENNITALRDLKYAIDQAAIVAMTDQNGVITYVNQKFLDISQYQKEELVGKTHRVINSGYHSKEFMAKLWKTILAGKVWHGELRNRAKDGSHYWVDTTITPFLGDDGRPKHFVAIRFDITQQKRLEQQKNEFISVASHELKTPVTSVKGFVQLLQKKFRVSKYQEFAHYASVMNNQVNKLTMLINDLLDITKFENGKLRLKREKISLQNLVNETVETMRFVSIKHEIKCEGQVDAKVRVDKERINQVMVNLLSNAIKYSPNPSTITVSLKNEGLKAVVQVKDEGIGIQAHDQKYIFERFSRAQGVVEKTFPGLGLGLYISREIIKRHSGEIWVESKPGKGSIFSFSLPTC